MRRFVVGWLAFAVLAAVALGIARFFAPGRFELELDVFLLSVGGLAVLELAVATREAYPLERRSVLEEALERDPADVSRPLQLERLERELTLATTSAFDLHARLRPTAREIARARLAVRGLRLEDAEDALGEDLWELVRPDRAPPSNRHSEGLPRAAVRRIVERLESL